MRKNIDIVALGELLIDFTEAGTGQSGMALFEQNPGGAPANLLTVASHMGFQTEFMGKVGTDMHGRFLKEALKNQGIGVDAVLEDRNYFTTLAFVAIKNGEREFSFARKPGADTMLRADELDKELLSNCKIFHCGSLSLTDEPVKTATLEAVGIAKEAGALISYDPNYRESLWESREQAIREMKSLIPFADVMKVSDEECLLLTGETDYNKAVKILMAMGPKVIAVTMGGDGVLLNTREKSEIVKGFKVKAVDTTGAGDSFWGGFLSHYLKTGKTIEDMEFGDWKLCAVYGNATAGLCVQKRGGIPAIPTKEQVEEAVAGK